MSDVAIRRIGDGDVADLRSLNALFHEVFNADEPDYRDYAEAPPSDAYLAARCTDPDFLALGAWEGDRPVGALAGYILRKWEQERAEIFIYDLAVAADRRRRGIATALIEAAREVARDVGAWTLFLGADQGDEGPIALYSKLGRREDVHHFDIEP
ncbi:GNAT family N-acetyltransferase [Sphingomicrobium clamense]|uniref:GNAT family N-acetyltransferase n=1 Tax=Sphingomicrobium clamense TaxID=2851013 RepID=A0ABS6V702_9SPHN|nr:GNAT family N-acetyltransferase [Sphingomicrobium sp. B8]